MGFSPPPFSAQSAPKNNAGKTILIVFGVLGLFCVIACGGFIFMGMNMMGQIGPMAACSINASLTETALKDYAAANNGILPPAATWNKDLEPFMQAALGKSSNKELQQLKNNPGMKDFVNLPVAGQPIPCMAAKGSDPASFLVLNRELGGKKLADIANPSGTVMLYEVPKAAYNATKAPSDTLPQSPYKMMGQPRPWFEMMADGDLDGTSGTTTRVKIGQ